MKTTPQPPTVCADLDAVKGQEDVPLANHLADGGRGLYPAHHDAALRGLQAW